MSELFTEAIADARSGDNSTSLTYDILSYWEKDKSAAIAAGASDLSCYDGVCSGASMIKPDEADEAQTYDCADEENRKTNVDGSCGLCLDGYTEDANGDCIADVVACTDSNRETLTDGSCDTDCKDGYEFDSDDKCVAVSGNGESSDSKTGWIIGSIVVLGIGGFAYTKMKQ